MTTLLESLRQVPEVVALEETNFQAIELSGIFPEETILSAHLRDVWNRLCPRNPFQPIVKEAVSIENHPLLEFLRKTLRHNRDFSISRLKRDENPPAVDLPPKNLSSFDDI
jgi:hypothetical protein